jgi:phosphoribosylamine--glycine ligase
MARIAIASKFSYILPWAARLQDEGHQVLVWNKSPGLKRVGENIVPLAGTFDHLYWWAKEGQLRREPTIVFFDATGMGDESDRARRYGLPVIGGGSFCDRLEEDRAFGFQVAEYVGCKLPPYKQFNTLTESLQNSPGGECYFKSDKYLTGDATKSLKDAQHQANYFDELRDNHGDTLKHIIQEKIEGVALSTARWWNGQDWVGPYEGTYEHKAFMNGDVGPGTGCSFNAVFFYPEDPPIAEQLGFERLTPIFRNNSAPPGIYDINAVVSEDGDAYFLEWTPRLGYDSELTSFRLIPDLGRHLFALAHGQDMPLPHGSIAYSIRLSVPPYPWEHGLLEDKGKSDGLRVNEADGLWQNRFVGIQLRQDTKRGLVVAGPEGCVGLSLAVGDSLSKLHESAQEYAEHLHTQGISGLQFRTDGGDCIKEDAEKVQESGHSIHQGLLT